METAAMPTEVGNTVHPALRGSGGYRIDGQGVILTFKEIANPRPLGDISGTLSLELWALAEPYAGGDFTGRSMGSVQLGQLFGQNFWGESHYPTGFTEPPAGTWFVTLMLREWTEAGSVTRDYLNFPIPYVAGGVAEGKPAEAGLPGPVNTPDATAQTAGHAAKRSWLGKLRSLIFR